MFSYGFLTCLGIVLIITAAVLWIKLDENGKHAGLKFWGIIMLLLVGVALTVGYGVSAWAEIHSGEIRDFYSKIGRKY